MTEPSLTLEQLRQHYEIEKALATRLREADREQRPRLYAAVYDELFRRVPFHPMLVRKVDPGATSRAVAGQMRLLRRFLHPEATFLEVGPGDCSLSFEVARHVRQVYAVDVCAVITRQAQVPRNFELIVSVGSAFPVPPRGADVAYTNQVLEHLHPEDAFDHLRAIHQALVPGGVYVCTTPNRLSGPHDVSAGFDPVPTGLHLKEYAIGELAPLLRLAGFSRVRAWVGLKGVMIPVPVWPVIFLERVLETLPYRLRRRLAGGLPLRAFLGIRMSGRKPRSIASTSCGNDHGLD